MSETGYYIHRDKEYFALVDGTNSLEISKGIFRCPYCLKRKRQEYNYKDLLDHAETYKNSPHEEDKNRASHSALARYIVNYLSTKAEQPAYPIVTNEGQSSGAANDNDNGFVWPWVGILANVRRHKHNGRYAGESGAKDKAWLETQHIYPSKVQPIWNHEGHAGYSLVEFGKKWTGFSELMKFEKIFESKAHCKADYTSAPNHTSELYGWAARRQDYGRNDIVGQNLRKNGTVKTACEIQLEDNGNNTALITAKEKELSQKTKNATALAAQTKATESLIKLAQEQKQEKAQFRLRFIELQQKLDVKQQLELEIQSLKGALQVLQHIADADIPNETADDMNNVLKGKLVAYRECEKKLNEMKR